MNHCKGLRDMLIHEIQKTVCVNRLALCVNRLTHLKNNGNLNFQRLLIDYCLGIID